MHDGPGHRFGRLRFHLQPHALRCCAQADRCNLASVRRVVRSGFGGVVMLGLGRMAATERLPRNYFAGIRIPSTLRSDEAWRAGHRAAASALTVAGVGPVVAVVIVAAKRPDHHAESVLLRIANLWLLAWLGLATVQANRAARDADVSSSS